MTATSVLFARSARRPVGEVRRCPKCSIALGPNYHIEKPEGELVWWNVTCFWECSCSYRHEAATIRLRHRRPSPKILITGPGRAGTTFLIRLFTRLGFNTGYCPEIEMLAEGTRESGCEHVITDIPIYSQITPRILKSSEWCFRLRPFLENRWVAVEHAFVPVRDAQLAAKSRLDVNLPWGMESPTIEQQEAIHRTALGTLTETLVLYNVPHTFLRFPRLVQDSPYCYDRLIQGWKMDEIPTWKEFQKVFKELAKPEMVKFG